MKINGTNITTAKNTVKIQILNLLIKINILSEMLGLKERVVQMAKANGVRWYGHVLRRDDGHVLRKALEFEVKGKRKRGQPKKMWKTQVDKESKRAMMP